MTRELYVPKAFRENSRAIIERANAIIDEYQAQGFVLTLRQLYYQFVARDMIENTQQSYNRLGSIVSDARLAGLIDWEAIEDRTRNLAELSHWRNPASIMSGAVRSYRLDMWENQDFRCEVWIEKEALVGVIEGICEELDVPYFACRGYVSQSEQWAAGKRLAGYADQGQTPVILHLGDHDPSGLDMTRDNTDRLALFARMGVEVERLALNMDQVEEYSPPPNPAKTTDSRYVKYIELYGDESWELDALDPSVIRDLISAAVLQYRDEDLYAARLERQEDERETLRAVKDRWGEVAEFLEGADQ